MGPQHSDCRVEALFEGEAEAVRRMIEWFFSDPSSGGVEVHFTSVYQETPSGDLVGFEIR
jgi:acylphosphatase